MKFLKTLPGMAVAICFAPMVHASTGSFSLKVTDLSFSVQDLAPQDGIMPSFEILNNKWTSSVTYSRTDASPLPDVQMYESLSGYLGDISFDDIDGIAKISSKGLELSNSAAGLDYMYNSSAQMNGAYPGGIRLSPNSLLMWSFKLEMTAQAECSGATYCGAAGYFNTSISGLDLDGASASARYFKSIYAGTGPNSGQFSDIIYLPFVNSSQKYVDLMVEFSLTGTNSSYGAVPEPTSALLLGAGLAICGWQLRTRSKLASS